MSKRLKIKAKSEGTLVLDAQGLSLHVDGDEGMRARLVDALVVATAALCTPPVLLVTSDRSHVPALCKAAEELPGSPKVKIVNV
ncbi:hypothetical protein OHA98_35705 [Streptomyces sp. NBC_00654]|uniref:hypothetical protein n=1 Tax=Streptomyces sp. NBC_00654 TaxID=2975799 RepID=UPI00224E6189|nr:hypothetical protein [Streptomyces sp. NBC_00654]MCX4970008.1 hypothetical protein [Streptomyces sp. NBC_00654]